MLAHVNTLPAATPARLEKEAELEERCQPLARTDFTALPSDGEEDDAHLKSSSSSS